MMLLVTVTAQVRIHHTALSDLSIELYETLRNHMPDRNNNLPSLCLDSTALQDEPK